jgi:hypothetical protein
LLVVAYASPTGALPTYEQLAFLMLAANDHIPEWTPRPGSDLSIIEQVLGTAFYCTTFNRSDDHVRSLLRIIDILGYRSDREFDEATWERVQQEAFGTSFVEYLELFLIPLYMVSRGWNDSDMPP